MEDVADSWIWIYVLRDDSGLIKIGRTTNIDHRVRTIMNASGHKADVIATAKVSSASVQEQLLHQYHAPWRTYGEWYKLSDDQIHALCNHLTDHHYFSCHASASRHRRSTASVA